MAKFDYANFNGGGDDTEFVAHASKHSIEETIELCIAENDWRFSPQHCEGKLLRKPERSDVVMRYVQWYVRTPYMCGHDDDGGGCYSYCNQGQRSGFPVWVIEFEKLKHSEGW